jgi:hypothetical protein
VLVVRESTLELESRDLVDHVIHQEGIFVVCFSLNVLMVHTLKFTIIANGNNLTSVGFMPGETIYFGSMEFTADLFGNLSLSPKGNDSGVVFIGIVHSGSTSLHTILEESSDKGDTTSCRGGSFGFLNPRGFNVVTPIVLIVTTPPSESIPALLTIPMVRLRTATPQLGTRLLPEQQQAY